MGVAQVSFNYLTADRDFANNERSAVGRLRPELDSLDR